MSAAEKQQKMMSDELHQSIEEALQLAGDDAAASISALDQLISDHGDALIQAWRRKGKHPDTPAHELVRKKQGSLVLEHLVGTHGLAGLVNEPRASDLCTPLHLAAWTKNSELVGLLLQLGAEPTLKNKYGEDCAELVANVMKKDNLVWLDLELKNLPADGPVEDSILECAVIVTDKDLKELERATWVVSCEEKELQGLSKWHRDTFKSAAEGGNGLFGDVLLATTNKEAMEEELLALLARHCPKGMCRLAGNSVHCDREVLLTAMPRVYRWCSHQVIDVSTLSSLVNMWLPAVAASVPSSSSYNHRAEADIEASIAMMKWLRSNVLPQPS